MLVDNSKLYFLEVMSPMEGGQGRTCPLSRGVRGHVPYKVEFFDALPLRFIWLLDLKPS